MKKSKRKNNAVIDARHLFNKEIGKYRKFCQKLNFGTDFEEAAQKFEEAISHLKKLDLSYDLYPEKDEHVLVINIFEGVNDSSVGAKAWDIASISIYDDGIILLSESEDFKDFIKYFKNKKEGNDEGFATAVKVFITLTLPHILGSKLKKNPIKNAYDDDLETIFKGFGLYE